MRESAREGARERERVCERMRAGDTHTQEKTEEDADIDTYR